MLNQSKAITFDVDPASLLSLREALPGWQIAVVYGATVASLPCDWNPGAVDLLVVGARANATETIGLCRFLASGSASSRDFRQEEAEPLGLHRSHPKPARRAGAPILVLVPSGQESLIGAALEAGARSCLMRPIHTKEVASLLVHTHAGNQPTQHTRVFERAQREDRAGTRAVRGRDPSASPQPTAPIKVIPGQQPRPEEPSNAPLREEVHA
jgi:hypothetical protein